MQPIIIFSEVITTHLCIRKIIFIYRVIRNLIKHETSMKRKLLIDRNKINNEDNENDDLFMNENTRDKDLLSIGDLAKYCRVSTKTLRHYDKKGILKPAYTDPQTGYRYYNEEQLFWLVMIKRLKQRNFSLEEAKEYLETGDIGRIRKIFEKKDDEIDKEIKKLQQIKKMINLKKNFFEEFLNASNRPASQPEIIIKDLPPRKVLSTKKNGFFNIKTLAESLSRLHLLQEKHGIKSEGLWMTLFHGNYEKSIGEKIEFEISISVESEEKERKLIKIIPPGRYATIRHTGSRRSSIEYYKILLDYLKEKNLTPQGPLIKIYLISYAHSKSSEQITSELQVMIKE